MSKYLLALCLILSTAVVAQEPKTIPFIVNQPSLSGITEAIRVCKLKCGTEAEKGNISASALLVFYTICKDRCDLTIGGTRP